MAKFQVDLLDVGAIEYGDSVLVQAGGLTALIDGGKTASGGQTESVIFGESVRHRPLDQQVSYLLDGKKEVDLVVVTHCHSDHIGCLPKLFEEGRISCKWALVADAQLGYGITADEDLLPDFSAMQPHHKLRLALREEPCLSDDPAEISAFIEDAAREYTDYVDFVKALRLKLGAKCVEYRGLSEADSPGIGALLAAMAPMQLKIYGPTITQLVHCASFLEGRADSGETEIAEALREKSNDLAAAYLSLRTLAADFDGESDAGANGNAVNNQSLVMSVSDGTHRVLLTGDMQFVKPQLDDDQVKTEMRNLIAAVEADAPFDFVKLSHHGATNGQSLEFLRRLKPGMLGISTGSRSRVHPTKATLDALAKLDTEANVEWARVDINGRCRYFVRNGKGRLSVRRNDLNDLTLPTDRAGDEAPASPPATRPGVEPAPLPKPAVTAGASDGNGFEVVVRLPPAGGKVSLTIEAQPSPLA